MATAAEPDDDDKVDASFWLNEIKSAQRKYTPWHQRGDRIVRRYKDEADDAARSNVNGLRSAKKMPMLWSNVETLKPALYSQTPKANVTRRNKDADPVGRVAAQILERCTQASLATQVGMLTYDDVMGDVRDDLLLVGQGLSVEEYVADLVEGPVGQDGKPTQVVANQRSVSRYIHWKDWLTNTARMWSEVWWWGYRSYLTEDEVEAKFGDELADKLQYTHVPVEGEKDSGGKNAEKNNQAVIWTIWSKRHGKVYQVAEGYSDALLGEMNPPCQFEGFWPFPRPVQSTVGKDSIIPVPDFVFYQDQADTIDTLTNRIDKLSNALRVRGLYPADMASLARLIQDGSDLDMMPVENWAMLAERGGAASLVAWFPIKDVAAALLSCYDALEKQKGMLYEITGLGDILRGQTDPNETATAQQIKGQWGSLRIRVRQRGLARYARDMIRLKAEIIAEHFNQETLQEMSGFSLLTNQQKEALQAQAQMTAQQYAQMAMQAQQAGQQPPPPPPPPPGFELLKQPSWEDVISLLRNSKLRGFVIDVESDSTVEPDQQQEQQKAVEFLTGMTAFMEKALPIAMQVPPAAPMVGEMLMFGVRHFKVAAPLEAAIEKFVEQAQQMAQAPKPPPPEAMKAQTDQQIAQVGLQTAQVKAQAEAAKAQIGLQQTVVEHETTMREKQADAMIDAARAPMVMP